MAKIMTSEVIFHELREGRLSLDSEFLVSENAWRKGGGPSSGSSMFAQLNSRIKLVDLLRGIIVQSGNDASIAAAEGIAGSEENFARMMNERARQLGLAKSTFRNATGYHHPEQKVTARDLARLTMHMIDTYPELYKMFGEREFTWNKIRQQNRNPLLAMDIGADGVKTGNIDESGFGLVGSAVQNGQRLIVVVNGLKTGRDRANESRKLLDWGFRAFEPRELFAASEPIGDTGPLRAPVQRGAEVARLRVTRGDVQALDLPLYAGDDIGAGTLTQRAIDGLLEFGTGLVRGAFARI
jgi:D-alanyl-D-alanine carboxypeptidase (penicillin-binding protein 5/6)